MSTPLPHTAHEQLFFNARTHSHWQNRPVSDDTLHQLYECLKFGPTSANCSPGRFVFVKSQTAKDKLKPCLSAGNIAQTMTAPVCVIVAQDSQFYEHLPHLYPHTDAKSWFVGHPAAIESTAFRNSSLQAAYLIMAARAFGLDCGPMSGFDPEAINQVFFPDGLYQANMLINLGYGEADKLYARNPRLDFDQACQIL